MSSDALQLTTLEESPLWLEVFGSSLIIARSFNPFVSCNTKNQIFLKVFETTVNVSHSSPSG